MMKSSANSTILSVTASRNHPIQMTRRNLMQPIKEEFQIKAEMTTSIILLKLTMKQMTVQA